MNTLRLTAFTIAIGLLGGCAFGERQAKLGYPPAENGNEAIVSVANAATAPAPRGTVHIAAFEDVRPEKRVVGHVRNGFGMKTAEVVAQRDVPTWVREAIASELQAAGYAVAEGTATEGVPVISGAIIRVYCDAYFTYEGEVMLRIETARAGESLIARTYTGKGSAGVSWAATGDSYSESLSLALQDALRQFIAELNSETL